MDVSISMAPPPPPYAPPPLHVPYNQFCRGVMLRPSVFSGEYGLVPQRVRRVQDLVCEDMLCNSNGERLLSTFVLEMLVFIDEETTDKPPLNPVDAVMAFLVDVFDRHPERLDKCMFYIVREKMHVRAILEWKTAGDLEVYHATFLTACITHRMQFPACVDGVQPRRQFRVHVVDLAPNASVRFTTKIIERLQINSMQNAKAGTMLDSFFCPDKWTRGDRPWGFDLMAHARVPLSKLGTKTSRLSRSLQHPPALVVQNPDLPALVMHTKYPSALAGSDSLLAVTGFDSEMTSMSEFCNVACIQGPHFRAYARRDAGYLH